MKYLLPAIAAASMAVAPAAHAKREIQAWPIAEFMSNPDYMAQLNGVTFTWGDVVIGQAIATTNVERATEGMTKSDQAACEWALLSALKLMRLHALERGAKSVQALKSTVAGEPYASDTDFLCMSGFTNSRVFLTGSIVMDAPPTARASSPAPAQSATHAGAPIFSATPTPRSAPEIDPEQQRLYGDHAQSSGTDDSQ